MSFRDEFYENYFGTKIASNTPADIRKEFDNKIDAFIKINTPKSLFKFYSSEQKNFESLNKNLIYLNTAQNFNDIFDSCFYVDDEKISNNFLVGLSDRKRIANYKNFCNNISPEALKMIDNAVNQIKNMPQNNWKLFISSAFPMFQTSYKNIIFKAEEYIKTVPKLTCFTEDVTSVLMWSHYADKHKGYALEFDFSDIQNYCAICTNKCKNEHYFQLYPVVYSDKRFEATDFVTYYLNCNLCANCSLEVPIFNDDIYSLYKILLLKNKNWEYEKEWRLITISTNCYFERINKKPKAIYIGVNAARETVKILLEVAKKFEIPIYKMNYDYSNPEYKLNMNLIKK